MDKDQKAKITFVIIIIGIMILGLIFIKNKTKREEKAKVHIKHKQLINDLDHLIGNRYYLLERKNKSELSVIIFKRYEVDSSGNVTYTEYPENFIGFLKANLKGNYEKKINLQVAPYIPPGMIDEGKNKARITILLLSSLIGVIILFASVIIFRIVLKEYERRRQNKSNE